MKKVLLSIAIVMCMFCFGGCKEDLTDLVEETAAPGAEGEVLHVSGSSGDIEETSDTFSARIINSEAVRNISWDKCFYNEGFLYYGICMDTNSDKQCDYCVRRFNMETEEDEELFSFSFEVKEYEFVGDINSMNISADGDLQIYYRYKAWDGQMSYVQVLKMVYGTDGTRKSCTELEKDEDVSIWLKCAGDREGNTYISSMDDDTMDKLYMLKYDADGRLVKKMECNDIYTLGYVDGGGRMVLESGTETGSEYRYVDFESGKIDKDSLKELNDKSISAAVVYDYDGCLLLAGNEWVYSYDTETKELKQAVNLKKQALDRSSLLYCAQMDDVRYLFAYDSTGDGDENQIILLERSSNEEDNRRVIRMAGIYENDSDLKLALSAYNRNNSEYRIDYVGYGMDGNPPVDQMMRDIIAGNVPDIYVLGNMDVDNLIAKNMLEDLTPFMEKDEVLNKDYFVDGYLDATAIAKKQYVIMKNFKLCAIAGRKSKTGSFEAGWTMEDLVKYYKSQPKGMLLFKDSSGYGVFRALMSGSMGTYVDWENGKCNFDSSGFRSLLEMCYALKRIKDDTDTMNEWPLLLKDGKLLFGIEPVKGPVDIQYNDVVFGSDTVYLGYPSESGGEISLRASGNVFAMSSVSDNKEAVWNVLKELMTGSYNKYSYDSEDGIPVSKKDFDKMVTRAVATEKYTDEDGIEVEPLRVQHGYNIMTGPAGEQDIALLKELISRATFRVDSSPMLEVMEDDVMKYLDGGRSLEDTVNVIQDKMTKYVNENS